MGLSHARLRRSLAGCCAMLLAATASLAADGRQDPAVANALTSAAAEAEWAPIADRTPDPDAATLRRIAELLDDRDLYVAGKAPLR
jgi:hypothetical protein